MAEEQGQQQQTMQCMNEACKEVFIVLLPPAEVINSMTVSMVVWTHSEIQACPKCGVPYQMSVRKIQGVEVGWAPVRTRKDVGIVVPPAGFKLPNPPTH